MFIFGNKKKRANSLLCVPFLFKMFLLEHNNSTSQDKSMIVWDFAGEIDTSLFG
jgi:hypothetical protein